MDFPYGETVVLHTRSVTGQDALGNDTLTAVDVTVTGCGFDPGGSTENVQGQDLVTSQPTLYVPAETGVGVVDAVTVRGVRYEVDGQPASYTNPFTGWTPPLVVRLVGVTG